MCLQKLMTIHHCVFKILGKNPKCHGRKDTPRQRENSIPHHKQSLQGGYNNKWICLICNWMWTVPYNGQHSAVRVICLIAVLFVCFNDSTRNLSLGCLAQSGVSLTVNQGVAGLSPSPATFFCWDLVMKTLLWPFSPFRRYKKGSCQLLVNIWALNTGKLPRKLAQEQCG